MNARNWKCKHPYKNGYIHYEIVLTLASSNRRSFPFSLFCSETTGYTGTLIFKDPKGTLIKEVVLHENSQNKESAEKICFDLTEALQTSPLHPGYLFKLKIDMEETSTSLAIYEDVDKITAPNAVHLIVACLNEFLTSQKSSFMINGQLQPVEKPLPLPTIAPTNVIQ